MVAPFTLPVAVAGGLGRFDLSACAQSIEEMSNPAITRITLRLIFKFFIVVMVFIMKYLDNKGKDLRQCDAKQGSILETDYQNLICKATFFHVIAKLIQCFLVDAKLPVI
jgi:hypothetical protein